MVGRGWTGRDSRVKRPQGILEVVSDQTVVFLTQSRPPTPAFFRWWLRVEGLHSEARSFERRIALEAHETRVELELKRGSYQVTARWELVDAFGFTRLIPRKRWTAVLTVETRAQPFSPPRPPATKPGPWKPRRSGRRTGDPFDVRPYVAGDDLRRLHWPLYAHAGDLFVRTAEPSPPPSGHQFLVLDTEAASEEDLDSRLGRLVTWLQVLDTEGTSWTLAIPAFDTTVLGAATGPVLAALTPAPLPDQPVPSSWPPTVTLLTGPDSLGAVRLSGRLAGARRRFQPVVTPLAEHPKTPKSAWWKR